MSLWGLKFQEGLNSVNIIKNNLDIYIKHTIIKANLDLLIKENNIIIFLAIALTGKKYFQESAKILKIVAYIF